MEITGKIHKIFDTAHISATFKKRDLVLEVIETSSKGDTYPQYISFQFAQDKGDVLNDYKVGDNVEVLFNLKGRHWKDDKYFNTLDAWQIHSVKNESQANPAPPQAQAAPQMGAPVKHESSKSEPPPFDAGSPEIPF